MFNDQRIPDPNLPDPFFRTVQASPELQARTMNARRGAPESVTHRHTDIISLEPRV